MPIPTILVHGYSAESSSIDPTSVANIYGNLASRLAAAKVPAIPINVSRYVSMDDGRDVDDVSLAVDRVLRSQYPGLLDADGGFNAIIHSTGALVMRNWVRRYSPKPSPLKCLVHLAGANLGSGWAHIGESDLAKWLRFIGQNGSERGLAVLSELELGSAWAIQLHSYFRNPGTQMLADYGVKEFNIVGTQAPPEWLAVPFRYGKEDGSDGVVRVSASNLNFNYVKIGSALNPVEIDWQRALDFTDVTTEQSANDQTASYNFQIFAGGFYSVVSQSMATVDVPEIPLAIPYNCSHSTDARGIVSGAAPQAQVQALILQALECQTHAEYAQALADFAAVTDATYLAAAQPAHAANAGLFSQLSTALKDYLHNPTGQYNRHAQVIIRVFDQNGKPVASPSVHFNSNGGNGDPEILIDSLFEDAHQNTHSLNTITYYVKTHELTGGVWKPCLPLTNGVDLEIDCVDPLTNNILYVPLRMRLNTDMLVQYIQPHRTTILDVYLLRLPAPDSFTVF